MSDDAVDISYQGYKHKNCEDPYYEDIRFAKADDSQKDVCRNTYHLKHRRYYGVTVGSSSGIIYL